MANDSPATSESSTPTVQQVADCIAFSTIGIIGTTQDLAREVLQSMRSAQPDPDVVAEETLSLVATTSARAAEVGLQDTPQVRDMVVATLLDLPYTYRDYLIGGAIIEEQDPTLLDQNDEIYQRLERKQAFYTVHFPEGQFPGEHALREKMALWMGRVSPPGLPETPTERLEELPVTALLLTHLKLVLAFGRRGGMEA
jgi:hypothetical protein